jgi:hypothetical protein
MMGDSTDIGVLYDTAAEQYVARFATAELLDAEARYIGRLVSIPHSPGDVMLDIGCGPALLLPACCLKSPTIRWRRCVANDA